MASEDRPDPIVDRLELVQLDFEQSLKVLDGFVRISATIRQIVTAGSIALIGLSFQAESPPLALAAIALTVVFLMLDAYHGWLYTSELERVNGAEDIIRKRYAWAAAPEDDNLREKLVDALDGFKFGPARSLPEFKMCSLFKARPAIMYTIYPLFIVAGIAAALLCDDGATTNTTGTPATASPTPAVSP